MTRGQLMVLARSSNSDLRAAAYQEQFRVYGEDGPILGQMYQTLIRDWRSEMWNCGNMTTRYRPEIWSMISRMRL